MNNKIVNYSNSKLDLAQTLRNIAVGLEDGSIDKVSLITKSNGDIEVVTDTNGGNDRTIIEQKSSPGYDKSSIETIKKLAPEKRRETVCKLKQEGLSQVEIAKRTNVSQKTISNDIKHLKENKEC